MSQTYSPTQLSDEEYDPEEKSEKEDERYGKEKEKTDEAMKSAQKIFENWDKINPYLSTNTTPTQQQPQYSTNPYQQTFPTTNSPYPTYQPLHQPMPNTPPRMTHTQADYQSPTGYYPQYYQRTAQGLQRQHTPVFLPHHLSVLRMRTSFYLL